MGIVLVLHFTGRELSIGDYTTVDINRQGKERHINITNDKQDFAFNGIFEQIQEYLGDDKSFGLTVKQERGEATFPDMAADYYLSNQVEILHFGKRIEQPAEQQEDKKEE